MADAAKQFLREFYSKMQHYRLMKMVEHWVEFLNTWRKL